MTFNTSEGFENRKLTIQDYETMIIQQEQKIKELSQQRETLSKEINIQKIIEYFEALKQHYNAKYKMLEQKNELELNQILLNPSYIQKLEKIKGITQEDVLKSLQ